MAHRAPSSSITYKWTYDVFLSFYGDDTCLGFASHLHQALRQRGIRVFLDDECIRTGENIIPTLFKAIEESRIAIIVFSENYANSTFCLRELAKILECFKEESRLIYPVFYYVDPSELRRPRGSYAQALARLEKRSKDNRQKVEKWRQALSQAVDLKGCHLKPKIANEQECIIRITGEVAARINLKPLHVTNYPVGLVSRVKEVISCLDLCSTKEIKMIGIWGARGIGKSTIARAVYNSIADNFEGVCFLSDVRKQSKMPNGLSHLQERLLGRLVMEKDLKLGDYHEGIPIIEHRLCQKKILLILDDVGKSDQLKALAGSCDWFGCGSRIIITTRNKQLLKSHGIESIYDVKELNGKESLKLLTWYAFKKENVDSNYMEVCNRAIQCSRGFPLVLEVIGSELYGKEVSQWNLGLDRTTFDQWVKMERIGADGFGIGHVGVNRITREKCAIKEMRHTDNLQTAHSVNQVQIPSRLEHQNIIKHYGSEIVNSLLSMYMESLRKYIRSREALQESFVRYFIVQILSGLVYLHSERLVHRDIKSDNILADYGNNVKLADFGLAKHLAQSVGNRSKL